jgi:16S rRNA G966 N2-methylase RsmD
MRDGASPRCASNVSAWPRGSARVVRADAARAVGELASAGERFGIVFLDPPYDSPRASAALDAVAAGHVLVAGAVVVIQHGTKTPPADAPGALTLWKARRFGETTLTFFRRRVD